MHWQRLLAEGSAAVRVVGRLMPGKILGQRRW
jgi:hypothetical protein